MIEWLQQLVASIPGGEWGLIGMIAAAVAFIWKFIPAKIKGILLIIPAALKLVAQGLIKIADLFEKILPKAE